MAHRGHKSSKVPNVKLRPTNPGSSSRLEGGGGARAASSSSSPPPTSPHPDGDGGHDGEYDDGEDGGGDKDRPLKGWMFCFTGVTQEKTTLTQQLYSMGGMAEGNLTESTTHLIAYKVGSSKYDCAIQLGLPILLPSFITELHEQWQKAQENIDIDGLLREHTMPPLAGLKVGLCGLTENTRKLATRKLIKELGAELVVPMRFDADVTHLVCAQADVRPSTTLTHAKKYRAGKMGTQENQRAAQQLACVHLEWLKDCERARALLPPHDYDAWPCGKGPTSTVRAAAIQSIPDRAERALKERVKEVMQREEERKREAEPPRPTRSNGTATAVGRVSKKIAAESQLPEHESITPRGLLGLSREVADAAERSELRKAPDSTPLEEEERADREKRDDPPAKDKEDAKPADPPAAAPAPAAPCAPSAPAPPASRGIFSNLTFRLLSCPSDRLPLLRSALYGAGASDVVAGTVEGAAADYCLLSSASSPAPPDLPSTYGQPVTLHWLDQCLFYERVVEPTSAPWLRPPGLALPLPAASQCVVALTGFPLNGETPERQQLRKALETVGCKVTDTFAARENTHLLSARAVECRSLDQAEMESKGWIKEARAIKWGTPLVGVEWVERIWREGRVEPAPKTKGDGQLSESALAETQIASSSRPSSSSSERARSAGNRTGSAGGQRKQGITGEHGNPAAESIPKSSPPRGPCLSKDLNNSHTRDQGEESAESAESVRQPYHATQMLSTQTHASFLTKMQNQVAQLLLPTRAGSASSGDDGAGHQPQAGPSTTSSSSAAAPRRSLNSTTSGGKAPPKSRRVKSLTGAGRASSSESDRSRTASLVRDESRSPVKGAPGDNDEAETLDEAAARAARLLARGREEEARRRREREVQQHNEFGSAGPSSDGAGEHSMVITYRDPQGERERQRLEDLLVARQQGVGASMTQTQSEEEQQQHEGEGGGGESLDDGGGGGRKRPREHGESMRSASAGGGTSVGSASKRRIQARKQPGA